MSKDTSILINGQHWNWEKVDQGEFDKWKILDDQLKRVEAEARRLQGEMSKCVERTREKYRQTASLKVT